jgi:peptidoglycan-N-acetylglucosamine deacetylase
VVYDHGSPSLTSSRRLSRGPLHGLFVTLLIQYLLGYTVNRLLRRTVIRATFFQVGRCVERHPESAARLHAAGSVTVVVAASVAVARHPADRAASGVRRVLLRAWEVFQPDAARLARRAVAKTRPGSILIFHDGFDARGGDRARTVEAVRLTLDELTRRGYRFVTVDRMLGVPAYREPG